MPFLVPPLGENLFINLVSSCRSLRPSMAYTVCRPPFSASSQ